MVCKKCGRETYRMEIEEFTMKNICKGCELVESVCRCRPLDIRPLFDFESKSGGDKG